MPADEKLLAEVPFFKLLDDAERAALADVLDQKYIQKGDFLFKFGDPGDALYLVRTGAVELFFTDTTGARIVLATAQSGDFFGELSLLDGGPRAANALALEDTELLELDRGDLQLFIRSKPDAALDMLSVMGQRLRNADALARGRVTRNTNTEIAEELSLVQRLANFIAEYSGSMPFLGLNAGLFLVWIVLNVGLVPGLQPFDPFPFGLLTMAVSLEAIFLSIFVLLAQNLQAAKDHIRGDIEYEVNLKAELEVAHLHERLEHMNAEILARLHLIEKALGR